jgi:predicted nucleic acid-binding protein
MKRSENEFVLKPLVYIETTVFSFHDTFRTEPEMVAMRNWTREWWQTSRGGYESVSSVVVLDELKQGVYDNKEQAVKMALGLEMLSVSDEVLTVAEEYMKRHLMPKEVAGDALHLALASYYGCQYLLTWNCKHLANTRKQEHIRHVNTMLGVMVPTITTPMELL